MQFAQGQQWFFQDSVRTYGVRTNALHNVEREFWREVKALEKAERNRLMELLWNDRHLESGALACYLYRRFARESGRVEFKMFTGWIDRHVTNWAHCDAVSSWLLAACIGNEPELRRELALWAKSKNRWKRRAAAVSLLQEAKRGRHLDTIFDISRQLLPDRDDMVEKGVGCLLKETYPAWPKETVAFLREYGHEASRVTLRYAAEKMTERDKKAVLGSA